MDNLILPQSLVEVGSTPRGTRERCEVGLTVMVPANEYKARPGRQIASGEGGEELDLALAASPRDGVMRP